jgi:hypothetical protein
MDRTPSVSRRAAVLPRVHVLLLAVCVLAMMAFSGRAGAEENEESEPRLYLPGGHVVRPGQWIDLRWTPADRIAELEILLSVDGGRHYTIWVSPRLDPDRCRYLWQVPALGGAALSIRIRFNRDGREIEGAPMPLELSREEDQPEPLALPPLGGDADRAPRPGGRGESPQGRACVGTSEATDDVSHSRRASAQAAGRVGPETQPRPHGAAFHTTLTTPRFVPLRA